MACPEGCPQQCDSANFITSISVADYPSPVLLRALKENEKIGAQFANRPNDSDVTYEEIKRSVLSLVVYYDDLTYTSYSEVEKTSIIDLVSNIGGTLGLFLGMSFLSFVEIFDLLFQICLVCFSRPI